MKITGRRRTEAEKFTFFKYCEMCEKKFKPYGKKVKHCNRCKKKRKKIFEKDKKEKRKKGCASESFHRNKKIVEKLKKNGI